MTTLVNLNKEQFRAIYDSEKEILESLMDGEFPIKLSSTNLFQGINDEQFTVTQDTLDLLEGDLEEAEMVFDDEKLKVVALIENGHFRGSVLYEDRNDSIVTYGGIKMSLVDTLKGSKDVYLKFVECLETCVTGKKLIIYSSHGTYNILREKGYHRIVDESLRFADSSNYMTKN